VSRWLPERLRRRAATWGVDARGIAWQEDGLVHHETFGADAVALAAAVSGARQVEIVAANELAVHWLQAPPASLQSLRELRLVAQARCAHLHGGRPDDWWVAGDWSLDEPFVCAALPFAVVRPVGESCARRGLQVRWSTAWSLVAGRGAHQVPANGWTGLRSPERALLWHCAGGGVTAMTSMALAPGITERALRERTHLHLRLETVGTASQADAASDPEVHWIPQASAPASTPAGSALALAAWLGEGFA
jgi:hypothetical protein